MNEKLRATRMQRLRAQIEHVDIRVIEQQRMVPRPVDHTVEFNARRATQVAIVANRERKEDK
jgi:hypothetical protein